MRSRVRVLATALLAIPLLTAAAPVTRSIVMTARPGSVLEAEARTLVADDLSAAKAKGDQPLLLIGTARLGGPTQPQALFVQVQAPSFCGSAGCSTTGYLRSPQGWKQVMDTIAGPIRIDSRRHKGMHDLLVHDRDRWIWNGTTYVDTVPAAKLPANRLGTAPSPIPPAPATPAAPTPLPAPTAPAAPAIQTAPTPSNISPPPKTP